MSDCVEIVNHSKVKVGENGRSAIFLNPEHRPHEKGQIDGCLVTSGIRADYFVANETHCAIIELKGADIDRACKQLLASAAHQSVAPYHHHKQLVFLIVCTRVPRQNTSIQIFRSKAKRTYNASVEVACNRAELNLAEL